MQNALMLHCHWPVQAMFVVRLNKYCLQHILISQRLVDFSTKIQKIQRNLGSVPLLVTWCFQMNDDVVGHDTSTFTVSSNSRHHLKFTDVQRLFLGGRLHPIEFASVVILVVLVVSEVLCII